MNAAYAVAHPTLSLIVVLARGSGATPREGQTVKTHYDGRLTDGSQVDRIA